MGNVQDITRGSKISVPPKEAEDWFQRIWPEFQRSFRQINDIQNAIENGIAVMPGAGTTVAFVLRRPRGVANYSVALCPEGNLGFTWISAKTVTGFTINCSAAPAGPTNVGVIVVGS